MKYNPDQIVKTCSKLQSGLRFGPEGVRACQLGPFASPIYWTEKEAAALPTITKEMIVEKRQWLFDMLNDDHSDIVCKKCAMVEEKPFSDVSFDQLGRIDHAPRTICNLRCNFCGFTKAEAVGDTQNGFIESSYDSLKFLNTFTPNDVEWDAAVDFNGGETSLIKNIKGYLEYFKEMKIRVLLFTNSVKFNQSIYDGLKDGSIQWVVTSIDCGTPSTYKQTKTADVYTKVLENVTRYAHAGSLGGGNLAIKYIFTEDNCSDDDVVGFAYAMLAVRPQRIWLTFDFAPFGEIPPDADNFGRFDFTKQIDAYVKLYKLLSKHGLTPVHYTEGHLARISKPGKLLLQTILDKLNKPNMKLANASLLEDLLLKDFRLTGNTGDYVYEVQRLERSDVEKNKCTQVNFSGKTIAIAPATPANQELAKCIDGVGGRVVAMFDRSTQLHGREVAGVTVYPYEKLFETAPDIILVAAPQQHESDIYRKVKESVGENTLVYAVK